jgi:hypothetical protein
VISIVAVMLVMLFVSVRDLSKAIWFGMTKVRWLSEFCACPVIYYAIWDLKCWSIGCSLLSCGSGLLGSILDF